MGTAYPLPRAFKKIYRQPFSTFFLNCHHTIAETQNMFPLLKNPKENKTKQIVQFLFSVCYNLTHFGHIHTFFPQLWLQYASLNAS